ncbi:hypothetical protein [Nitriliruptor alkaliphilus]|uniref:hypothetical protein n=1 Tax=Nitriliruptor alkaliphilus TaxID=427918 RepID=UPI000696EA3E|nr:hypothetical protein [Nitriliruptor alkaliphilus]
MRFSVSLVAEGDREVTHDEVLALADEVAELAGIASGIGATSYGAQIVVEAASSDEAVDVALQRFAAAVTRAGLPVWPVTRAETVSEQDDLADLEGDT